MSELDKMRAALRAAAPASPAQVVVPVDDEDMRCMLCGGTGQFDGAQCKECGGCGLKREGEKAPRLKLSKAASEALMDKMWFGPAMGMRVTLLSDEPSPLADFMSEVDDETKLTGAGLITDKIADGVETSVRFSKRMFVRPGGMIRFGVIHNAEGAIASVFKMTPVIHDGDEYRARFKMAEEKRARRPPKPAAEAKKPEELDGFSLLDSDAPGEWLSSKMKERAAETKTHLKPFPRECVDCGKKLVFRPPSGYDATRCVTCRAKREAITGSSKLEDD